MWNTRNSIVTETMLALASGDTGLSPFPKKLWDLGYLVRVMDVLIPLLLTFWVVVRLTRNE